MHHIAIMKPELQLLEKVVSGQKTIESRWLRQRRSPWHAVNVGDTIFFKNSGHPVSVKAAVKRVVYFENLSPVRVRCILAEYGEAIGVEDVEGFYLQNRLKRYCVLLWLEQVQLVKPFEITKQGFGAMAAWLSTKDVAALQRKLG